MKLMDWRLRCGNVSCDVVTLDGWSGIDGNASATTHWPCREWYDSGVGSFDVCDGATMGSREEGEEEDGKMMIFKFSKSGGQ